MKLYICNFYSYSDRKLLYYDSLNEYAAFQPVLVLSNFSFKYNDNVNTEQIVNVKPNGNYCLLCKDDDTIESRWYIIGVRKHRTNQYSLILKRDVLADYYTQFKDIKMMINRATPLDTSDINIFNREQISFNKIKQAEYEIKDETNCAWIVGYVPRNYPAEAQEIEVRNFTNDDDYSISVDGITNWEYYKYVNELGNLLFTNGKLQVNFLKQPASSYVNTIFKGYVNLVTSEIDTHWDYGNISTSLYANVDSTWNEHYPLNTFTTKFNSWASTIKSRANIIQGMLASKNGYGHLNTDDFNDILALNGLRIKDTATGFIYEVQAAYRETIDSLNTTRYEDMDTYLNQSINETEGLSGTFYYDNSSYSFNDISCKLVTLKLVKLESDYYSLTFSKGDERKHLNDQPYDIFCMPYEDIAIKQRDGSYLNFSKQLSLALAQSISEQLGSASVYDIQLLPFCPIRGMIKLDTNRVIQRYYSLDDTGIQSNPVYLMNESSKTAVQKIYWCTNSNFSFQKYINKTYYTKDTSDTYNLVTKSLASSDLLTVPSTVKAFKIKNLTKSMRFCAPDYSNFFDFNLLMNNGFTTYNVECTYMPYSPYIRVYPTFQYLYGSSFNDSRGLILKGDYSIPQLSSTWANYKMNNKNYLNTFNLETQMLTKQNEISKAQDIVGAITGTMSGAASGAMSGAITGGGAMGAVAGGIVGGLSSLGGGIADITINQQMRDLQMSNRQKNFNFSIENMQAIPYGLSSAGTFNFNRHLFPFIEFYCASNEEISLLGDWLDYNGMTMHKIDTIANYSGYIESSILTDSKMEENIQQEINGELNAGVYKEV